MTDTSRRFVWPREPRGPRQHRRVADRPGPTPVMAADSRSSTEAARSGDERDRTCGCPRSVALMQRCARLGDPPLDPRRRRPREPTAIGDRCDDRHAQFVCREQPKPRDSDAVEDREDALVFRRLDLRLREILSALDEVAEAALLDLGERDFRVRCDLEQRENHAAGLLDCEDVFTFLANHECRDFRILVVDRKCSVRELLDEERLVRPTAV